MPDGSFSPRKIFDRMSDVFNGVDTAYERNIELVADFRQPLRQYAREFAELYYDSLAMPTPSKRLIDEFFEGCSAITGNALSAKFLKNETDLLLALTNNWGHLRSNDTAASVTNEAISEAYGATSAGRNEGALLHMNATMANSTRREINNRRPTSELSGYLAKVKGYFEPEQKEAKISISERNAFLAEEFPSLLEDIEELSSLPIASRIEAIAQHIQEERAS